MDTVKKNLKESQEEATSTASSTASTSTASSSSELEAFKKQQKMLENELMRVKGQLEASQRVSPLLIIRCAICQTNLSPLTK